MVTPRVGGLAALLLADLVPVVGVLFLGWQVFPIILLYWLENVVVGAFTALKMARAQGVGVPGQATMLINIGGRVRETDSLSRAAMIAFFCFHYGIFTLVHGVFVFVLFGFMGTRGSGLGSGGLAALGQWWFWLAFACLIVSHWVSYRRNFIGAGEYLALSPAQVMQQPYGRVVVMHLTILGAGFLLTLIGAPLAGLLLLIGLKSGLDVRSFRREHHKVAALAVAEAAAAPAAPPGGVAGGV